MSERKLSRRGSEWLDLLRALAAFTVMIGHVRGLFFVSYQEVTDKSILVQAIYFATGLGHEAVMVFFVLSGYFISAIVLRTLERGEWGWGSYLLRRMTRLYVVLVPALLIGLVLDRAGIALFGLDGPYGAGAAYQHIILAPVDERLGLSVLLGNAAYLQEILTPTFGSNGPLWSLSYEFWYYMMFPCLALALLGRMAAPARIAFAFALLAIAVFVGPLIAFYFLIWLFGLAVFLTPPARRGGLSAAAWRAALVGAAVAALAALAFSRSGGVGLVGNDFIVALAFAILIYVLAQAPARRTEPAEGRGAFGRSAHVLAGFSYTLYLIHLPILVFLTAWNVAGGGARWQPDTTHLAYGAGIAAFTLLCAAAFAHFTEARTGRIRAFLSARVTAALPRR